MFMQTTIISALFFSPLFQTSLFSDLLNKIYGRILQTFSSCFYVSIYTQYELCLKIKLNQSLINCLASNFNFFYYIHAFYVL